MTRVGIAILGNVAAIAVVENGESTWTAVVSEDRSIAEFTEALAEALTRATLPRWPRPRVSVALGPPHGRVKPLHGVPPVKRQRALRALVEFNRERFVASRRPVSILGVQSTAPGEALVGIADDEMIASLRAALANAPVRLRSVVPLECIRGTRQVTGSSTDDLVVDATAAAALKNSPLALDTRRPAPGQSRGVPWWRLTGAGVVFLCSVGAAAATPVIRIVRETRADSAAVRALAATADTAAQDARELASARRDLHRVADFSNARASATLLLGQIAATLPATAVISTIHIDTVAVELVVLSPRTADVIDALGDVPGLSPPLVIGPVSREVVAGHELDRATVRATFTRGDARGRTPFAIDRDPNAD